MTTGSRCQTVVDVMFVSVRLFSIIDLELAPNDWLDNNIKLQIG
jgi:hypothetical protein